MKSEFELLREQHREKLRKIEVERTGIDGYCPCCGVPHYVSREYTHDKSCIWYTDSPT